MERERKRSWPVLLIWGKWVFKEEDERVREDEENEVWSHMLML